MMATKSPKLLWDWGTAYDMFISLEVLHKPAKFGVRSSWASSIRKRIPAQEQKVLEQGHHLFGIPFNWIHALPAPKDAITVLYSLQQIPASERIFELAHCHEGNEWSDLVRNIAERGSWTEDDFDAYQNFVMEKEGESVSRQKITGYLDGWTQAQEIGEKLPEALQVYQEVFFTEEEKRIRPAL